MKRETIIASDGPPPRRPKWQKRERPPVVCGQSWLVSDEELAARAERQRAEEIRLQQQYERELAEARRQKKGKADR